MKQLWRRANKKRKRLWRRTKRYTPREYVKKHFPDAPDSVVENIIWGLTGFPYFWHLGKDGDTPYQCFTKQVREVRAKMNKGQSLLDQEYEAWDKPMEELRAKRLAEEKVNTNFN